MIAPELLPWATCETCKYLGESLEQNHCCAEPPQQFMNENGHVWRSRPLVFLNDLACRHYDTRMVREPRASKP